MDTQIQTELSHGNPAPEALVGKDVFFYDGVCVYCKGVVEGCLAGDAQARFYYSPLQSPFAQRVLGEYGIDPKQLLSMYVASDFGGPNEALRRAAPASTYVLRQLTGELKQVGEEIAAKPRAQQDAEYKDGADNRYERYGIMDGIWMADGEQRGRFVF